VSPPDLRALCDALQSDLRLRDWRVDVAYVPDLRDSSGSPVYGLCSHLVDAKRASVAIRDPRTPLSASDPSVEEILIHELVHLHFAPLSGDTRAEIAAEEQAVWSITEALASARTGARKAQIARAMVAGVERARRQRGRTAPTERRMDPVLLAAIVAALNNEDPAQAVSQVKELISQLQSASAPAEEPMSADAPPAPPAEEPKPPMQAAAAPDPTKCAKPAPTAPAAQVRQAAPAPAAPAAEFVTRRELDRYQASQHLTQHGAHLTEAQRTFAAALTLDGVKRYLASHPAPAAPAASSPRKNAPTQGARSADKAESPTMREVDRRMGIMPPSVQAIGRDSAGRLTISNIATATVQVAKDGAR